MYKVEFYEKVNGESPVWDYLEDLRLKANKNKNARIKYQQAVFCIEMLQKSGTNLPIKIAKHIEKDIWELRPGDSRIFYFYYKNGIFVLLHVYHKKTRKTPGREIERAQAERDDYLAGKEPDLQ